tara:strand:- start:1348 stop:1638 length:291 start_codon:yes stop_codon:yes gene_type:complete
MRKILFVFLLLPLLSNCGQYSAMIGPSYTLVETGNILQASTSLSSSLAMKNAKQSLVDEVNSNDICPTVHSSELSAIFFETLENMDCHFDPMSIYR